jgi:hypothetical protein
MNEKQLARMRRMQALCDRWNEAHQVGEAVIVRLDDRTFRMTRTRSKAEVLDGCMAVVWLEDLAGCFELGLVVPMKNHRKGEVNETVSFVRR